MCDMFSSTQPKGDCKACREGELRCDREKPRCSACVEANKPCGGYEVGNIFINLASTDPPSAWDRSQSSQRYLVPEMAPGKPAVTSRDYQFSTRSPFTAPTHALPGPSSHFRSPLLGLRSPSLTSLARRSSSGPRDQIHAMFGKFLDLYYGQTVSQDGVMQSYTPGSECGAWRILLPSRLGHSQILDTAIGALSTVFVGKKRLDNGLIEQGRNMYGSVLQMTQQAISDSGTVQREDLLATTLIMSSIELFLSNGASTNRIAHIEGASRLLHGSWGSQRFEELHVYTLIQGLCESIISRRAYNFALPTYQDTILQLFLMPRTSRNDFFFQWNHIMLPLPNVLNAADRITTSMGSAASSNAGISGSFSSVSTIFNDLRVLDQSIIPWYESMKSTFSGPWTHPSPQSGAESVPFPLQFVSVEASMLYCLYWASQLLITEVHYNLQYGTIDDLRRASLAHRMGEFSSLICRSCLFCTQGRCFAACENFFFPLSVVTGYYKRQGDEGRLRWCVDAFFRIAQEQNIWISAENLGLI